MIKTYVLDTSMLQDPMEEQAKLETWMDQVSPKRMEKIQRIRHPNVRKQSLGAGLLLHKILGRQAPGEKITYRSYGKPTCAQIPFNLSHTDRAVILSIWEHSGAAQPFTKEEADVLIGCDIERMKPYKPSVARRFFTKAEYESLEAVKDPQVQAELFCRYWTKKESVMKLTGLGMSLPMELYDVQNEQVEVDLKKTSAWLEKELEKGRINAEYEQAADILQNKKLFLKEYRYEECCIAVCSFLDEFEQDYILVSKL